MPSWEPSEPAPIKTTLRRSAAAVPAIEAARSRSKQSREIVDEIERVLDLMRDAGGQLAECSHFLRLDQTGLCRLQIAQRRLGRVSRCANRLLGMLSLGDVAVDKHEAATGHRIAAHLDDPTVWPRPFEAHFAAGIFEGAAQLRFEIGRVLAAVSEIAEILGPARPPREEGVRQLEHLLEIAVPGGKPRLCVEHDDAIAHVVKGDAKLGLAVAQLVEQPRVLDRAHRLIGEAGGQLDLFVREGFDARAVNRKYTDQGLLAE